MHTGQQSAHKNFDMSTSHLSEEEADGGDRKPGKILENLFEEAQRDDQVEWVEDEEMEGVSYLLEWRISEDMGMNLQCCHDGGHDDDVLGDFIVADKIESNASKEHSNRENNDFIVPEEQCQEAKGSNSSNSG